MTWSKTIAGNCDLIHEIFTIYLSNLSVIDQIFGKYWQKILDFTWSAAIAGGGEPRAEHPPCRPGKGGKPANNPWKT